MNRWAENFGCGSCLEVKHAANRLHYWLFQAGLSCLLVPGWAFPPLVTCIRQPHSKLRIGSHECPGLATGSKEEQRVLMRGQHTLIMAHCSVAIAALACTHRGLRTCDKKLCELTASSVVQGVQPAALRIYQNSRGICQQVGCLHMAMACVL